jgi:hypothetical protein
MSNDRAVKELRAINNLKTIGETLKKAGIPTKVSHQISEEHRFVLSLNGSRKRLDLDLDLVDDHYLDDDRIADKDKIYPIPQVSLINVDSERRQAVLRVRESARKISRDVTMGRCTSRPGKDTVRRRFPIALPQGTTYEVKFIGSSNFNRDTDERDYRYEVVASAPKSDQFFLVGFDEKHMFVSMLPKAVTSVAEAHSVLAPKEVQGRKDVLRQGEFFFIPVTEAEIKILCRVRQIIECDAGIRRSDGVESDHYAMTLVEYSGHQFATGPISHERHEILFLNGWYRVAVNNELPNPSDQTQWD